MIVEDSEDDLYLIERVLSKLGIKSIFIAADGEVAIDYLSGCKGFSNRKDHPIPNIILLDLKLPEVSGHQVLEWVSARPEWNNCQVYVLFSSGEARDRERANEFKAAGYFVKPLTTNDIDAVLA